MIGAQALRFAVQLVGLAALSRILTAEDFGQVAMVVAVTGLAAVVGDFGLSLATIRVHEMSRGQWSNLFWLNTLVGLVTCAVVALLAGPIARFYGEPGLQPLVVGLSTVFAINGVAAQYRAELNRQMRFGALAKIESAGPVVGLVLAIGLGIAEFGAWALVAQQVGGAIVVLVLVIATMRVSPGWPNRHGNVRSFLKVGGATTVTQAVVYVSSNIDTVAIGRVWGATVLGIYSRAFQLFMVPLQQLGAPLTRVAVPALTRLRGTPRFYEFLRVAEMCLGYGIGIALAVLAGLSEPLLAIVLGPQWSAGWIIVEILAIGGLFQALGYVYYWSFLTLGRMRVLLLCETTGRLISVVLIILLVSRGTAWVAAAYSAGLVVVWLMTTFVGARRISVRARPLIAASVRPTAIAVGVYLVGKGIRLSVDMDTYGPLLVVLCGVVAITLLLGAVALLSRPVRQDVTAIVKVVFGGMRMSQTTA